MFNPIWQKHATNTQLIDWDTSNDSPGGTYCGKYLTVGGTMHNGGLPYMKGSIMDLFMHQCMGLAECFHTPREV